MCTLAAFASTLCLGPDGASLLATWMNRKRRPLHSIKIRGRWNSDASLKRYAKESRLMKREE